jgi:hypothetical protein
MPPTPIAWPQPGPITAWPASDAELDIDETVVSFPTSSFATSWWHERYPDYHEHQDRSWVTGTEQARHKRNIERMENSDGMPNGEFVGGLLLPDRADARTVRVFVFDWKRPAAVVGNLPLRDADAYRPVVDRLAEIGRLAGCPAKVWRVGAWVSLRRPWQLMAELDQVCGPDPRWPPQYAISDDGWPYISSECPNCSEGLNPLPVKSAPCPTCGEWIGVQEVRGRDRLRSLTSRRTG